MSKITSSNSEIDLKCENYIRHVNQRILPHSFTLSKSDTYHTYENYIRLKLSQVNKKINLSYIIASNVYTFKITLNKSETNLSY